MSTHFQNPSLPEEPALETEEASPGGGPSSGKQMGPVSRFLSSSGTWNGFRVIGKRSGPPLETTPPNDRYYTG